MNRTRLEKAMMERGAQDAEVVRATPLDDRKEWAHSVGKALWDALGDDDVVSDMADDEQADDVEESWTVAMDEPLGRAVRQDLMVAASAGESLHDPDRDNVDDLEVDETAYEAMLDAVEDGFRAAYSEAAE